ncbi:MAG: hypothetical protein QNJ46_12885 [Leptolyngbyaceae cyanobacterium MO_188.B28]|nr:hypothetical protein [Leptolyngbyaceae cyanobacterium MO_188.B28]
MIRTTLFGLASDQLTEPLPPRLNPIEEWIQESVCDRWGKPPSTAEAILLADSPEIRQTLAAAKAQACSILSEQRYGKPRRLHRRRPPMRKQAD